MLEYLAEPLYFTSFRRISIRNLSLWHEHDIPTISTIRVARVHRWIADFGMQRTADRFRAIDYARQGRNSSCDRNDTALSTEFQSRGLRDRIDPTYRVLERPLKGNLLFYIRKFSKKFFSNAHKYPFISKVGYNSHNQSYILCVSWKATKIDFLASIFGNSLKIVLSIISSKLSNAPKSSFVC